MHKHYNCHHFSLCLPWGEGQDNVPNLLEHLANTINKLPEKIDIQDIVFSKDMDEDGLYFPKFTIYYYLADDK